MAPEYQKTQRQARGPVAVLVALVLVLVVVVGVGAFLVVKRLGDKEPDEGPVLRPEAVTFRRVLTAVAGSCAPARAAEDRMFCGPDGYSYTLGEVEFDGRRITEAKAGPQQGAVGWQVTVSLDKRGSELFADLTTELSQLKSPRNQVAIVIDSKVVTAPTVSGPVTGGQVQISGNYSRKEAEQLADQLSGLTG